MGRKVLGPEPAERKVAGRSSAESPTMPPPTTREDPRRCAPIDATRVGRRHEGRFGVVSRWARGWFMGMRSSAWLRFLSHPQPLGSLCKARTVGAGRAQMTTLNVGTAFPTRHGFFPRGPKPRRSLDFLPPVDPWSLERVSHHVPKWGYDVACHRVPAILATLARIDLTRTWLTRWHGRRLNSWRRSHDRALVLRVDALSRGWA